MTTYQHNNSTITTNDKGEGVSFAGKDSVDLFGLITMRSALGLYKAGIKPSRNAMSATKALQVVGQITGNKYKRGEFDKARDDLQNVIDQRKALFKKIGE